MPDEDVGSSPEDRQLFLGTASEQSKIKSVLFRVSRVVKTREKTRPLQNYWQQIWGYLSWIYSCKFYKIISDKPCEVNISLLRMKTILPDNLPGNTLKIYVSNIGLINHILSVFFRSLVKLVKSCHTRKQWRNIYLSFVS